MNKAILDGYVGQAPELRKTTTGTLVCNFTLATHRRFTDSTGNRQIQTEWHNVVAWGKIAESVHNYVGKGDALLLEGELRTKNWDNQGTTMYRTEIHAKSVEFRPKRNGSSSSKSNDEYQDPQIDAMSHDDCPF